MHAILKGFLMFFSMGGILSSLCARDQQSAVASPLQSLVKGIISIDDSTPQVLKQVTATAEQMETEISRNASQLQASVDAKAEELKKQAEDESKKIFERYTQEAERLKMAVAEETRALQRTAAERIMEIATKAEEEALKAKQQARRAFLEEKLATYPEGLDNDWKGQLKADFSLTIGYLKDIVQQGESPAEADDFMKRFDAQAQWFETTLAATQSMNDAGYYQLHQKKEALGNIVDAQKKAEAALKKRYTTSSDEEKYKKLRLLTLYEINDFARQKSGNGVAAVASTMLSSQDIDKVINKVLEPKTQNKSEETKKEAVLQASTPTTLEMRSAVDTAKLAELADKIEKGKDMLAQLVQKTSQDAEKGKEAIMNLVQKSSQDTQQVIGEASKKVASDTTKGVVQKLASQFEILNKDQLEMYSIIMDACQRLSQMGHQAASSNLDVKKTLMTDVRQGVESKEALARAQEVRNRLDLEVELELLQKQNLSKKL